MKKIAIFLILIAAVPIIIDAAPRTPADIFIESYTAQMRRQTQGGNLDNGGYHEPYIVCDEHHHCSDVFKQSKSDGVRLTSMPGNRAETGSFSFNPAWQ